MKHKVFSAIPCAKIVEVASLFSNTAGDFHVRTDIFNEDDFKSFFKRVTSISNVKFHKYFKHTNVKQYHYSESFVCHHGGTRSVKKDLK